MDHIIGVSNLLTRQKAKEQRARAVTLSKTQQLQRSMIALGVYLRKNVIENIQKENDICLDAGSFGKFTLANDPEADSESLYPKKIVYEPTSTLASLSQLDSGKAAGSMSKVTISRPLDMSRLIRLVKVTNAVALRKDLDQLTNQLAQIMIGNNPDSNLFKGKTVKINMRIGWLIASACGSGAPKLSFEALPLTQIISESREQNDDMMSKVSTMSKLSLIRQQRASSISVMENPTKHSH